jgi:hypothetical protein
MIGTYGAEARGESLGSRSWTINLGLALAQTTGRLPEAIREYRAALRLKPGDADVDFSLGSALTRVPGGLRRCAPL